jgi:hypothetical protein
MRSIEQGFEPVAGLDAALSVDAGTTCTTHSTDAGRPRATAPGGSR